MIKQPPNPNTELPNRHTTALGLTGAGKSQVIKQKSCIPKSGARVVLFDPSRDHPGTQASRTHYFSDRAEFARALAKADQSGRGFRIGYDGQRSPEIYDWWCACCIAILDGRKLTYMLTEELARVSKNAGAALEHHQFLLNESRKYGGIYVCTTQFPARISKDVYDNSGVVFFGRTAPRLQSRFAAEFGLDQNKLAGLENLQFLRWEGGNIEFLQIPYEKNT